MTSCRRPVVTLFCLMVLVSFASACTSDESSDRTDRPPPSSPTSVPDEAPATTAPLLGQPVPTFEALSDAFAYGDDAGLDQLWDACASGSGKACDDLYFAAPTDSEYETFGYTCGDRPNLIICAELDEEPGIPPSTR